MGDNTDDPSESFIENTSRGLFIENVGENLCGPGKTPCNSPVSVHRDIQEGSLRTELQKNESTLKESENEAVDKNNENRIDESHSLPRSYYSGLDYDKKEHVNNLTPMQTRSLYLAWKKLLLLSEEVGNCIGGGSVRVVTDLDTSAGMDDERPLAAPVYLSKPRATKKSSLVVTPSRRASGLYTSIYGSSTPDLRALSATVAAHESDTLTFIKGRDPLPYHLQSEQIAASSFDALPLNALPSFILPETDSVEEGTFGTTFNEELWRGYLGVVPDIDTVPLCFLRARKWDQAASEAMLLDTVTWRAQKGILDIVFSGEAAVHRGLLSLGKTFVHGVDRDGRLVIYIHGRLHDKNMGSLQENERFTLYLVELARRLARPGIEAVSIIFDMTGSGYANLDLPNVKFLVDCFQNHYPETLGRCFIVNAPWLFSAFWKLVKPMLDPVVAAKIIFIDKKSELLEYLPRETLLLDLGGDDTYHYDFEIGLKERPLSELKRQRSPRTTIRLKQLKREFLKRKAELVSLTRCIADELEPLTESSTVATCLEKEPMKRLVGRRNYMKHAFYMVAKQLAMLTEPKTYYHRVGVLDALGNVHWEAAWEPNIQ
jgi:CRAL/TRIO domain